MAAGKSDDDYLRTVEARARAVVDAAVDEGSFDVFGDGQDKTELQQAITELARTLRYRHYAGDGCLDHD